MIRGLLILISRNAISFQVNYITDFIFFLRVYQRFRERGGITNRSGYYKIKPRRRIRARNLNKISHIIIERKPNSKNPPVKNSMDWQRFSGLSDALKKGLFVPPDSLGL